MFSMLFNSLLRQLIDTITWVDQARPKSEATDDLATLRESVTADLHRHNGYLDEDSCFLELPEDRRLHDAERGLYLALIEFIDAKMAAINR